MKNTRVLRSSFFVRSTFFVRRSTFTLRAATGFGFRAGPQVQQESRVDLPRAYRECDHTIGVGRREVLSVLAVFKAVFCFRKVSVGDLAASRKFFRPETPEPFGDISRRRSRRPSNLIAKLEISGRRTRFCQREHLALHFVRKLPGFQVLKSSRHHSVFQMHTAFRAGLWRKCEQSRTNGERRTQNVERVLPRRSAVYAT